ncbi:MAG: hypothetical protein KatS3mg008_1012 [Acidimicrobiales bacterium]|nr:MAG: hypothetical protein KatS3mg008_1012 [Acidimicrobiales bacterium]
MRSAERRLLPAERVVLEGWKGEASPDWVSHPDPRVRVLGLGALHRSGRLTPALLRTTARDEDRWVRARTAELCAAREYAGQTVETLLRLLADPDPAVVEAAAWALGRALTRGTLRSDTAIVSACARVATGHADGRCRETAVAALGATRDDLAVPPLRHALGDRRPVRRRAAIALSRIGTESALECLKALTDDPDLVVRQTARDALEGRPVL